MLKNLKILRKEAHLSQEQMAEIINVSLSTYFHYETGNADIGAKHLLILSKYF